MNWLTFVKVTYYNYDDSNDFEITCGTPINLYNRIAKIVFKNLTEKIMERPLHVLLLNSNYQKDFLKILRLNYE